MGGLIIILLKKIGRVARALMAAATLALAVAAAAEAGVVAATATATEGGAIFRGVWVQALSARLVRIEPKGPLGYYDRGTAHGGRDGVVRLPPLAACQCGCS